ncbi:MAG: hypothetical protein ACMXYL_01425 [Candidatus Woesearchaeota archaeon]
MKTQELIDVGVKLLSDVKDEHIFHAVDGRILQNIHDLVALLDTIQDEHFYHHVTQDRNDFALWIENCIGDLDLSLKIRDAPDAQAVKEIIKQRLEAVEKALLDYENETIKKKEKKSKAKSKISVDSKPKKKRKSKKSEEPVPEEAVFGHSDILGEIERAINETKDRTIALEKAIIDNETAIDAVHAASQKQSSGVTEKKFYWGDFLIGFAFGTILGIIATAIYYGFML